MGGGKSEQAAKVGARVKIWSGYLSRGREGRVRGRGGGRERARDAHLRSCAQSIRAAIREDLLKVRARLRIQVRVILGVGVGLGLG